MKLVFFFLLVSFPLAGSAQSSARFTMARSVVAGGGTTFSTSARFQLGSTVAQPLAAVPTSARFSVQGGFWIRPAPVILVPAKAGNSLIVPIQTELGETYTLQYVDSLSNPVWQTLTNITGDGTIKSVTNSAPEVPQRFYRLLQQ